MKRVLIITASLDVRSGWGRYSRAVVDQLIAQDVEVVVCAEVPAQVPYSFFEIAPARSVRSIREFINNIRIIRRAARSVDVVHALDGWPYGVYGYFATIAARPRLFISGIGTYSVAPLYAFGKSWLMRLAYGHASKIFSISAYTREQLIRADVQGTRVVTIHMGTSPLPDISVEEVRTIRDLYGLSSAYPAVLTVGEIKHRKGQLDTIQAIEILKREYPSIKYVVVGSADANYLSTMNRFIEEHDMKGNVVFVHGAHDRTLACLYASCDLVALNSNTDEIHHHFEGFGLVITEASQFGKPSVGSRGSGIEDAIKDGETGYLTDQGDPKDIADKIHLLLQKYPFFSQNARLFGASFTWAATVSAYIKYYKES